MFRKKDLIVILCALGAAAVLFAVTRLAFAGKSDVRCVRIYVNGVLYSEEKPGPERDIVITGEGGRENVIHITEDGFYMKSASCRNQLCVDSGCVTADNYMHRAMGNKVICLPNGVEAELVPYDTDGSMPDA